jgi:hypothetical protein
MGRKPPILSDHQERFIAVHADALPVHLRLAFRAEVLKHLAGPNVANAAVAAACMGVLTGSYIKLAAAIEAINGDAHATAP